MAGQTRKKKGREMLSRNVRLTPEAHRVLSMLAAALDTSISEAVLTAVKDHYPQIVAAVQETDRQLIDNKGESN